MKILKLKKLYFILLVLCGMGYFSYSKLYMKPVVEYNTARVGLGTLVQTVTETGTIRQAIDVNLNFLAQGRLATITVMLGDKVKKGQVIAELDYTNLKIQAKQAEANLAVARANEQKVLRGSSVQDIGISQTGVAQANVGVVNAKKDYTKIAAVVAESVAQAEKNYNDLQVGGVITPSEAAVDSAKSSLSKNKIAYQKTINNRLDSLLVLIHDKNSVARTALDAMNRILIDENAKDTLGVQDSALLQSAKSQYDLLISLNNKVDLNYEKAAKSKTLEEVKVALELSDQFLDQVVSVLNDMFSILGKTITSSRLSQSQIDTFKSSMSSQITLTNSALSLLEQGVQSLDDAQTNYDTVISNSEQNLNSAEANLNSARQTAQNNLTNVRLSQTRELQSAQSRVDTANESLKLAQAQLNKTAGSARIEDVALVSAQVKQAQASLESVQNQINNSIIRAPFYGQITQINYEVGEEPSVAKPVIVLLGEDQYQVEVDISESDIAKVAIGNIVELDFDAFGEGIKFNATLDKIDPAQTVIQEVVYYRAKAGHLMTATTTDPYLEKIKPGMTANLSILTNKKEGALIIPYRAVMDVEGQKIVRVKVGEQVNQVSVRLGLRGDNGLVEVLDGLTAGQEIILSIKTAGN